MSAQEELRDLEQRLLALGERLHSLQQETEQIKRARFGGHAAFFTLRRPWQTTQRNVPPTRDDGMSSLSADYDVFDEERFEHGYDEYRLDEARRQTGGILEEAGFTASAEAITEMAEQFLGDDYEEDEDGVTFRGEAVETFTRDVQRLARHVASSRVVCPPVPVRARPHARSRRQRTAVRRRATAARGDPSEPPELAAAGGAR